MVKPVSYVSFLAQMHNFSSKFAIDGQLLIYQCCTTPQAWGATLDEFLPSYYTFEILLSAPACVTGLTKPFLQNKGTKELFP